MQYYVTMSKDKIVENQEFGYRCTFDGCDLTFPNSGQLSEHVALKHSQQTVNSTSANSMLLTPIVKTSSTTTNELMEMIRRNNPFEQKFREANNKALEKSESYSQILSFLNSSNVTLGSFDSFDGNAPSSLITTMSDIGLGGSSDLHNLQLKLPDTSSLLSGIGLDTPDIANLVNQVGRDDMASKSAPQTADVLKTVLDLRETVELQEAEKRKNSRKAIEDQQMDKFSMSRNSFSDDKLVDSDIQSTMAGSPPSLNPFDTNQEQRFITQQIPPQQLSTPATTEITSTNDNSNVNPVYISLKINDQLVRIPIQIGFVNNNGANNKNANIASSNPSESESFAASSVLNNQFVTQQQQQMLSSRPTTTQQHNVLSVRAVRPVPVVPTGTATPTATGTPIRIIRQTLPAINKVVTMATSPVSTQQQQASTSSSFYYQPIVLSSNLQQDLDESFKAGSRPLSVELATSPSSMYANEEIKKKETLERNKQAAWRYRKRKKEEMGVLADKVKILESEKLELKTQVHVLKMELARVNKILDQHKNCSKRSAPVESGGFNEEHELHTLTNAEHVILNSMTVPSTNSNVQFDIIDEAGNRLSGFSEETLANLTGSGNIIRYVSLPVSSTGTVAMTTAGATSGSSPLLLLSNGQLVVPSSTNPSQLQPYLIPLVKRSSSPPADNDGTNQ